MVKKDDKMSSIRSYVARERARLGKLTIDRSRKVELSGEAFGEFAMLLDVQLMTTEFGYGAWAELENTEVLEGVYLLVEMREAAAAAK